MRGVICERFGWTYKYLLHGIPWLDVHYMMIDAPRFVPDEVPPGDTGKTTTEGDTADLTNGQKLDKHFSKFL